MATIAKKPRVRFSAVVARARAALAKASDTDALAILAESDDPTDHAHVQLLRARFYKQRRRYSEALVAYESSRTASPMLATFLEYIDLLLQLGSNDMALEVAEDGSSKIPLQPEIEIRVARSAAKTGDAERAAKILSDIDLSQSEANLRSAYIDALRALAEIDDKAATTILDAQVKAKAGAEIYRLAGERLLKSKRYSEGVPLLERAFQEFPEGAKKASTLKALNAAYEAAGMSPTAEMALANDAAELDIQQHDFRVAVITNVYNERFNLPIWLAHYGSQVGIENCVVLDHGSDDGSTADLGGAGFIRLPRGKVFNERHRMSLINNLANSLLGYYDAVIYTDCDEMLVADPEKYENLVDYAKKMKRPVVHAIGLNVRHDIAAEPALIAGKRILDQRTLVQFVSPMCKPLVIKRPVSWGGGFHSCDQPPHFNDLYLFHLRHADMDEALARLRITREIKFAREGGGLHHRRDEQELIDKQYTRVAKMKIDENFDLTNELKLHVKGVELAFSGRYAVFQGVNSAILHRIPERLRIF